MKGGQWSRISNGDQQGNPRITDTATGAVCKLLSFLHIILFYSCVYLIIILSLTSVILSLNAYNLPVHQILSTTDWWVPYDSILSHGLDVGLDFLF